MPIFQKLLKYLIPVLLRRTGVTQVVTTTDHGAFAFFPHDRYIGWKMALQGTRDPALTRVAEAIVRAGDLVVDAGANLGWYSVVLGRCVGAEGTVLAFEPEPRAYELLTQNLRRNGVERQVRAANAALSSQAGALTLELSGDNFGDHRVRRDGAAGAADDRYGEARRELRQVPALTLDDAVAAAGAAARPVRFIKMDCQGYEVEILRGARATLARTEALLLEYWPYGLRRCGATLDDLVAGLGEGFARFARLDAEGAGAPAYRPMAEFRADAAAVPEAADYLFRRS